MRDDSNKESKGGMTVAKGRMHDRFHHRQGQQDSCVVTRMIKRRGHVIDDRNKYFLRV